MADMPLSTKLAGKVFKEDFARLEKAFADPLVAELLPKCASVRAALEKVASLGAPPRPTEQDLRKTASANRQNVIQVSPTRYGYLVKWAAAPDGVVPQQQELSAPQAQQALPPEMLQAADEQGVATTTDVQAEPDPLVETPQSVEGFGNYKVRDTMGNEILGVVIPTLFDPRTGQPQPMKLFTNGGQFALQPDMAGVLTGISYNLPGGPAEPRGMGVFYKTDGKSIIATIPFNVATSVTVDGSQYYSATTMEGAEIQITPSDGIKKPVMIDANQVAMPVDYTWMPLNNQVELMDAQQDPLAQQKVASLPTMAEVRAWRDGDEGGGVVLSGPVFAKHGSGTYDWADGLFWMAAAGCPQNLAHGLFEKAASAQGVVKIYGLRPLSKEAELEKDAAYDGAVGKMLELVPRPCLLREAMAIDMHKEARALVGVDSIDTLLAVGLITPESIQDFVDGIPQMEETQAKLASLVFAVQLGLQSVPETAVLRAMSSLEGVITGLKALKTYQL